MALKERRISRLRNTVDRTIRATEASSSALLRMSALKPVGLFEDTERNEKSRHYGGKNDAEFTAAQKPRPVEDEVSIHGRCPRSSSVSFE